MAIPDQTYTGNPITVSPTVSFNGSTLLEDNRLYRKFY